MKHEAELNFFINFLKNNHIPCQVVTNLSEYGNIFDNGIRHLINPHMENGRQLQTLLSLLDSNKIYRIYDELLCHYLFFLVPDDDTSVYVVIGPYIAAEITQKDILDSIAKYSLSPDIISEIEKLYYDIPVVSNEAGLLTLVNTLGEQIWNGMNSFSLQDVHNSVFFDLEPLAERPSNKEPMDAFLSMKLLEERYAKENQLIQAVSQGQTHKALMLISKFSSAHMEVRTMDPIRNMKNYAVIANTLLRKAAETGTVHPLHIDSLSSRFANRIEQARSEKELQNLLNEMARKYCLLVKNHSMKGYSLLIRKVLVRIDSDLTADLSLKSQAEFLEINSSYLSTLFKKETGVTLTEYVNRKRIEYGIFLLNTTNLQIQTISQYCGIPDVNYFTKTFKKIVGKTPREYRDNVSPYSGK